MRLLTGIQPTGSVHLGNYVGAIRPALELIQAQKSKDSHFKSFLFIADYHALNAAKDPQSIAQHSMNVAATWLAMGLNPEEENFYRQSDVPQILEMSTILSAFSPKGLMNRAHAYKARVQENQEKGSDDIDEGINMGLYTYPILMSADILAFEADIVPVGKDNTQHLEIAKDLCEKLNRFFKTDLKNPKPHFSNSPLLPGLDGRKMSASYGNHIPLFMDEKALRKKVMRITTDSTGPDEPKSTDGSLIYEIFKQFATDKELALLETQYREGIAWGHAKQALFEKLVDYFGEKTEKFNMWMGDPKRLNELLKDGASKAQVVAQETLDKLKDKLQII